MQNLKAENMKWNFKVHK